MTRKPSKDNYGLRIRGSLRDDQKVVFDPIARHFLLGLIRAFQDRVDLIRNERTGRVVLWAQGETPQFLEDTKLIRDAEWRVAEPPRDLLKRTVEITGPVERKMIINALNSGADVFMADFEDSSAPSWENMVDGQVHLRDAARRQIEFVDTARNRHYRLNSEIATLMVRPRGLHLDEVHIEVDGRPAPASLVDFGLFLFHNARELVARGSGPYFYLPKLEDRSEARLWNDVFLYSQDQLGLGRGTIRATVLIETLPAAFQMDEILFELREHSAGLNCGRWDYIFSHIKVRRNDSKAVLPDRGRVTMDQPCMRAYTQLVVQTCHRRGIHAIGGMAAQIPIKNDPNENHVALERVRADKMREVQDGHDGTWVAHPGLVQLAREVFEAHMSGENQLHVRRDDLTVTEADLLAVPEGPRTESGLRQNVRIAIQYLEAWIRGNGCVPISHLMEDTATAEISRAQIWQWRHHRAALVDGRIVTPRLIDQAIDEENHLLRSEMGSETFEGGRFEEATELLRDLCLAEDLDEFLTLKAYPLLQSKQDIVPQDFQPMIATNQGDHPMTSEPNRPNSSVPQTRWEGVERPYTPEDVARLRGSIRVEHTIARLGAERLWESLTNDDYVHALGALTGNQAMQQVRAGLKAIYVSGWQVAADANLAGNTYPDQSLYPANSVPQVVKRINSALQRADQIEHSEHLQSILDNQGPKSPSVLDAMAPITQPGMSLHDVNLPGTPKVGNALPADASSPWPNGRRPQVRDQKIDRDWFAPIVADAEAGFGGPLNAHELMKAMIEAGAAGVHFEDQLSSEKKCGHLGGKVLIPTSHFVRTLIAARLAADVCDVPSILIARTDANSAKLLTSDIDPADHKFLTGERTPEGFFRITGGLDVAIARGLAYAPYADLIWCETSTPCLDEARRFADAIHAKYPTKMLAYNCSPSFNWKKNLDDATIAKFQRELGAMGYKFQFVTLAGFHQLNFGMFELARAYKDHGMAAYSRLQQAEFAAEKYGYTATRHQREVGTGYFDGVSQVITGGLSSTLALKESTEAAQF